MLRQALAYELETALTFVLLGALYLTSRLVSPMAEWVYLLVPLLIFMVGGYVRFEEGEKEKFSNVVNTLEKRIDELGQLLDSGNPDSIFYVDALAQCGLKPPRLWQIFTRERKEMLESKLGFYVEKLGSARKWPKRESLCYMFAGLCSLAVSYREFIQIWNEELGDSSGFEKVTEWCNASVVGAYNNFIEKLKEDARDLRKTLGKDVQRESQRVKRQNPLRCRRNGCFGRGVHPRA